MQLHTEPKKTVASLQRPAGSHLEDITPEDCLQTLIDSGTLSELPLTEEGSFRQAMLGILGRWKDALGIHSRGYFLGMAGQLKEIFHDEREWVEGCDYILAQTNEVYGNGSGDFALKFIPALISSGQVKNTAELRTWLDATVEHVHPLETGQYDFQTLADNIAAGKMTDVAQMQKWADDKKAMKG